MTVWQDVRYAFRRLARSPGFVCVAVVSLALGIGANALVFSTARALLLRSLPIPRPAEVFFVQTGAGANHSFLNYVNFRDRTAGVVDLAAYRVTEAAVDPGSGARSSWGYLASGNYFDMLGLRPALGRFFTAREDVGRNRAPYLVLSHAFWRDAFAADPSAIGRVVVTARTREIGIRIAVGGRSRQILSAVLGRCALVLAAGASIGVVLATSARSLLSQVVYQASSGDPLILAAGATLMLLVGLAASLAPARRALRVEPMVALRGD